VDLLKNVWKKNKWFDKVGDIDKVKTKTNIKDLYLLKGKIKI
jgi:hypothetical protein